MAEESIQASNDCLGQSINDDDDEHMNNVIKGINDNAHN